MAQTIPGHADVLKTKVPACLQMEGELQTAQLHTWPSEDRSGFKVVLFKHNSLSIKFIN